MSTPTRCPSLKVSGTIFLSFRISWFSPCKTCRRGKMSASRTTEKSSYSMGKAGNAWTTDELYIKHSSGFDKKLFYLLYAKFTITYSSRWSCSEFGLSVRLHPTLIIISSGSSSWLIILAGRHCIRLVVSRILSGREVSHIPWRRLIFWEFFVEWSSLH